MAGTPPPGYGRTGGFYPQVPGFEAIQEQEAAQQEATNAGMPQGTAPPRSRYSPEAQDVVTAAWAPLGEGYVARAKSYLLDAGVPDLQNEMVQAILSSVRDNTEQFDDKPGTFEALMQTSTQSLMQAGVLTQTPYSDALMQSGFGFQDPTFKEMTLPQIYGLTPQSLASFEGEGIDFVTNEQTGWTQWKNGTLVNPNADIGAIDAVIYEPNSTAPGSPRWLRETVPSWTAAKINEWRGKLIENGYLPGDQKTGPVDVNFINAMRTYQTVRYQNGGTPMPIGPQMPGATGTTPFNFRQLQGQIRADIRTQWMSIYGVRPSDDEIEPLEDMVVKVAHGLYKKGQVSASQAAAEAEERMIARMESSPEAQFVTQNVEENTQLHDQILRAVQVTAAMS
jgi:hypothetical protein